MSLFSTPKSEAPKEDPAAVAARQKAQAQAENDLSNSIQLDLRRRMQSRLRTFGLVPAASSAASGSRPSITSGFLSPV